MITSSTGTCTPSLFLFRACFGLIVRDRFVTDFLQMISGIGCFVSSAITLLVRYALYF